MLDNIIQMLHLPFEIIFAKPIILISSVTLSNIDLWQIRKQLLDYALAHYSRDKIFIHSAIDMCMYKEYNDLKKFILDNNVTLSRSLDINPLSGEVHFVWEHIIEANTVNDVYKVTDSHGIVTEMSNIRLFQNDQTFVICIRFVHGFMRTYTVLLNDIVYQYVKPPIRPIHGVNANTGISAGKRKYSIKHLPSRKTPYISLVEQVSYVDLMITIEKCKLATYIAPKYSPYIACYIDTKNCIINKAYEDLTTLVHAVFMKYAKSYSDGVIYVSENVVCEMFIYEIELTNDVVYDASHVFISENGKFKKKIETCTRVNLMKLADQLLSSKIVIV